MNIAVMGIDPGGATGVAWGVFNPGVDPWAALKTKMLPGELTITGSPRNQITELGVLWSSFYNTTVRRALLPPDRVWLVIEDFIYMPGAQYGGEDSKISTAIIWGLIGYRMGRRDEWAQRPGRKTARKIYMPDPILQTAGAAKGYATAQRFRDEDLWVKGYAGKNEHIFSAWQHIAFFLQRFRTGGGTGRSS